MRVFLVIISFLSGSIPFAYILYRIFRGEDIRKRGSGNVGATNALRSGGVVLGLAVAVLDISKAALPVYFSLTYGREFAMAVGLAAVLGHCFTPWLGFNGGKGVASYLGASLVASTYPALISLGFFVFAASVSGAVSAGSLLMVLTLPFIALIFYHSPWLFIIQAVASVVVVFRHRENIRKLLEGKERKIWKGFMS